MTGLATVAPTLVAVTLTDFLGADGVALRTVFDVAGEGAEMLFFCWVAVTAFFAMTMMCSFKKMIYIVYIV